MLLATLYWWTSYTYQPLRQDSGDQVEKVCISCYKLVPERLASYSTTVRLEYTNRLRIQWPVNWYIYSLHVCMMHVRIYIQMCVNCFLNQQPKQTHALPRHIYIYRGPWPLPVAINNTNLLIVIVANIHVHGFTVHVYRSPTCRSISALLVN